MKLKHLTLIITLVSLSLLGTKSAIAADIVGTQSYEVSWYGTGSAENYQLFYGQTSTNTTKPKDNAVALSGTSYGLKLNLLKPCTQYSWNVKANKNGKWDWLWGTDKSFTTGGVCSVPKIGSTVTTSNGKQALVTGVNSAVASWSPIDGATGYTVYYGTSENKRANSLTVSDKKLSETINFLNPNTTYYYQVAGWVNGKQVWGPVQTLKVGGVMKPVLGTSTQKR